ncbi:MAG: CapA family protein [Gemmataceae bacterium]|nr:CapA family protein [Gemmataceae bacterium]
MTRGGRRNPWLPAFALSVVALCGSLALLGVALRRAAVGTESAGAETTDGTRSSPVPDKRPAVPLRFRGALPPGLADAGLVAEGPDAAADLAFAAGSAGDPVTRYWVPVASMAAALDAVTGAQLSGLLEGTVTFVQAGGLGGRATYAGLPLDAGGAAAKVPVPAVVYADTAALFTAMSDWSAGPIVAFVPLQDVRPGVTALAVDGVDLVRGRGDPAAWPFVERTAVTALTSRGQAAVAGLRARVAEALPKVTRAVATGDILQSRCALTRIRATGDWAAALRGPVAEYLAAADLALGSLDGSIQDVGTPYGCVATTNLTSPPEVMAALTLAGLDEVTVATNHVFDCGQAGPCGDRAFLRTLELLQQAGIKTVGGGRNLAEALAPAIFEINGVRFAVLGFDDIAAEDLAATADAPGTAPMDRDYSDEKAAVPREPAFYKPASMLDLSQMEEAIRRAKAQADVVVVQVQSGYEDTHEPSPRSIKGLRAAAAAGADLVIGNQAHWVQAVETRGDVFVAYALGNFVFDQQHTPEHEQGYLLEASFWGKRLANVRLVPYQIADQYRPVFAEGALRTKILGDVFAASKQLANGE